MNKGKAKCEKLKQIRKVVADKIGVNLHQTECTFQGDCTGTCPKCKQEEDILNKALLNKASAIAVAGVATMTLAACGKTQQELAGATSLDPNYKETVQVSDNTNDTEWVSLEQLPDLDYTMESKREFPDMEDNIAGGFPTTVYRKVYTDGTIEEATYEEYEEYLERLQECETDLEIEGDIQIEEDIQNDFEDQPVPEIAEGVLPYEYEENNNEEDDGYVLEDEH